MCGQPLIADVIDYDEVLTGKRRETTYSGVNALITKPAISIANWGFLAILVKYGYDETVSVQPASVGDGVVTAYSVIPVITIIIAILAIMFFKLDGPEWIKKKHELQMIHEQKEKAFVESLMKEGKIQSTPN
jgi:GPH family glycoside/pentoside/hexuronide:cation symporter